PSSIGDSTSSNSGSAMLRSSHWPRRLGSRALRRPIVVILIRWHPHWRSGCFRKSVSRTPRGLVTEPQAVRAAAREVAEELDPPAEWLNDAAKDYIPVRESSDSYRARWVPASLFQQRTPIRDDGDRRLRGLLVGRDDEKALTVCRHVVWASGARSH